MGILVVVYLRPFTTNYDVWWDMTVEFLHENQIDEQLAEEFVRVML